MKPATYCSGEMPSTSVRPPSTARDPPDPARGGGVPQGGAATATPVTPAPTHSHGMVPTQWASSAAISGPA